MSNLKIEYPYASFNEEAKRFHVIRICHLISHHRRESADTIRDHQDIYRTNLENTKWKNLQRFCGLRFEIRKTCYLNPVDIGRLGGEFLPLFIGDCFESYMIPLSGFLCMTSNESVDEKVREYLVFSGKWNRWKIEPLSWYGYKEFRRLIDPDEMKAQNVALVFFQKKESTNLTKIDEVFLNLKPLINCGGKKWIVAIIGLLKGNIDGFVLLLHKGREEDLLKNAESLSTWLSQERQRREGFWEKTSPVVVYYGSRIIPVEENLVFLNKSNVGESNKMTGKKIKK